MASKSSILKFFYSLMITAAILNVVNSKPQTPSSASYSHCHRCSNGNHMISKSSSTLIIENDPIKSNSNSDQCLSGHYYLFLRNEQCECDYLCAKLAGQSCYYDDYQNNQLKNASETPMNNNNQTYCDPYLKLYCNHTTNLCQGSLSLIIDQITNDSIRLQWKSMKINSNHNLNNNNNRIINEIYITRFISQPLKFQFEKINSKINELHDDNNNGSIDNRNVRFETKIDKLKANTIYLIKVISNHREQLSIIKTRENENDQNEILPKVMVKYRNASSIALIFDDFKLDNKSGYSIHYRRKFVDSNNNHNNNQWLIIKSNGHPNYTLTGLRPNTAYMIQIFTWNTEIEDQYKQILYSEIIETRTLNGCHYHNRLYDLNETIIDDCKQRCVCGDNGHVNCRKRCDPPLISIVDAKPLLSIHNCTFISSNTADDNNYCCLQCQTNDTETLLSANNSEQFNSKPGSCPFANNATIIKNSNPNAECSNECTHDYHCTGIEKCCRNNCGQFSCQKPLEFQRSLRLNDDDDDLMADSNDITKHLCHYRNRTYHIGERFRHIDDDCQLCQCSEALEIECKRRCLDYSGIEIPKNCQLIDDLDDPKCCRKQICHNTDDSSGKQSPNSIQCHHLNRTYMVNESFYIGCDHKCYCRSNGHIDCQQRCPHHQTLDVDNYEYCQQRPDPDDPECCTISICDFTALNASKNLDFDQQQQKLLVEMAESINSTAIKLRLLQFYDNFDDILTIYYGVIDRNQTTIDDHSEAMKPIDYQSVNVTEQMILPTSLNNTKDILLTNLHAETDYSIYFESSKAKQLSNVVIVRTFPIGIDHTFDGCFHGQNIIQVGEIFYDGDCEFKCICKEGGIRDCFERCPLYIDYIDSLNNGENCRMMPSPDDSCCQIPVCDGGDGEDNDNDGDGDSLESKSTDKNDGCRHESGKHYQINDEWIDSDDCMKKLCKCMWNAEQNQSEIVCRKNCPDLAPELLMKSTENCPQPKLIQTNDPCVCPYIVCENNLNPLDLPMDTLLMVPKSSNISKNYCEFKGNRIEIGDDYYDNCRAICTCQSNATLDCRPIQCNHNNFGPHVTQCLEWEIDPQFVPRAPNCCPEPKCKNDGSCSYAGIRYSNYQLIPQELLPCHKRCMCDNGSIRCKNICPEVSDEPPKSLQCPEEFLFRGHLPGDNCCIQWQCRQQYNREKIYGKCSYNDRIYKLGEFWYDNETEIERRCQCKITNGILHVVCDPGLCQPIPEKFLEPTVECRTPTVVTPKDAIMCPYVVCNNSLDGHEDLNNVDIIAINSTSVRIRFTVPSLYLGLLGHAEVHYTTDINVPRNQWNIQKFARPKRLFDIANIEYHLGNLKPDTHYYLQIEIIIESLRNNRNGNTGPISEIYKIYLPPLIKHVHSSSMAVTPPSQSSPSTSSTLPPIIMLDMNLTAQVLNGSENSILISWRPFTVQEKKFIDGVKVRYKETASLIANTNSNNRQNILKSSKNDDEEDEWHYSQTLHRDIIEYQLNNLKSSTEYLIDLQLKSIEQINANIISSKPLLIQTPDESSIENNDNFHINPNDLSVDNQQNINIELRNLPRPVSKYVNIVRINYQNVATKELYHNYVNIDDDFDSHISLPPTNVLPNTRYKLWINLYLKNGRIITSNTIDLITNFNVFNDKTNGRQHLATTITPSNSSKYLFGLIILSIFMFTTGTIFFVITCICLRRNALNQHTASITKVCISEAAYDNPTYKTFETKSDDNNLKSVVSTPKTNGCNGICEK